MRVRPISSCSRVSTRSFFNVVEAQAGADIALNDGGSITLQPGTYRFTGFSLTTMQTTFAPAVTQHDADYPGYALIYRVADEQQGGHSSRRRSPSAVHKWR